MQLRQYELELAKYHVDVKIVTFDANFLALAYIKQTELNWPMLIDADQQLYRAYGFERASWWTLLKPTTIWGYLKLIYRGILPGRAGRDWHQLGGDIVIDPEGFVRLHHISTDPHDRPAVSKLLDLVFERN